MRRDDHRETSMKEVNDNSDNDVRRLLELAGPRVEPPARIAPATVSHAPATGSRSQYDFAELEAMSVVRLRQFARSVKNLGIQGRQISMANKTQLLDAIRNAR